ncbi:hypothetical protein [Occallatibacter riparius]|uniref:DUF2191 domain-containing protein n=1 Tax=Occallatibacter riparius TaxID=1002689 RepID=A0A9J7BK56_9BACT|nr:hypothetical protein [Occallatibacter riparius]UWZ83216.1 hypothetical protein MOP44_21925 [Occallatibacter riparius]
MRTTLSIDDDIAMLLEQEVRRSGKPFKVVVNRLLSLGLAHARQPKTVRAFKVRPRAMGLAAGQSYDNVSALLEQLEGPDHK